MSASILRKITLKTCGLTMALIKERAAAVENGAGFDLLKVVGRTTTAAKGTTDKGTFIKLGGEFTAINAITGEVFTSGACILPTFIAEQLAAALDKSPQVEFGLLIGAKRSDDAVTGYEFTVRPLIEVKPTESMQALLAAAGVDLAALPAPAPTPPASAPAPKSGKGAKGAKG